MTRPSVPTAGMPMVAVVFGLLALAPPEPVHGQHDGPDAPEHLALLASNALVGAAGAGLVAWLRGEDVSRAFHLGAVGGSISYAGKVTATTSMPGATLAGRQVAAVGHAIIANAAAGDPALSEIWLPFSPLRFRVPTGGRGWGVRLDLMDLTTLAWAVLTPELRLDAGLSLRNGTPVFVAAGHDMHFGDQDADGIAASGVILLSGDVGTGDRRASVLAHEMVHVIQNDFAKVAISYPIEHWAAGFLVPDWPRDGVIQGGFTASLLELGLAGVDGEGLIRDLVEGEAERLVRRLSRAPLRIEP